MVKSALNPHGKDIGNLYREEQGSESSFCGVMVISSSKASKSLIHVCIAKKKNSFYIHRVHISVWPNRRSPGRISPVWLKWGFWCLATHFWYTICFCLFLPGLHSCRVTQWGNIKVSLWLPPKEKSNLQLLFAQAIKRNHSQSRYTYKLKMTL